MKILVDNKHREYFHENGILTFEELISPQKLSILREACTASSYDLWRENEPFKKTLTHSKLGMIASELVEQKPIRLGYDQYLDLGFSAPNTDAISSIQGILCAALIDLTTGDVTFLKPQSPFPEITTPTLLVTFANERAVYVRKESDPHTHHLKQFGYNFGDRLIHAHNPIIYK